MLRRVFTAGLLVLLVARLETGAATAADATTPARFQLTDQHGRVVTDAELFRKPTIIHFGFTHCPVVCPTTLHEAVSVMRELGPLADRLNFAFVTIDPDRDTPELLRSYISGFDERIVGLTGGVEQIAALARALGAPITRERQADGSYELSHTMLAYIVGSSARKAGTIYMGGDLRRSRVVSRLRELAEGAGADGAAQPASSYVNER